MSFKGQKTGLEIVGVKPAMIVDLKHVLVKFFPKSYLLIINLIFDQSETRIQMTPFLLGD